ILLFLGVVALLVTVPRMVLTAKAGTLVVSSLPFWNMAEGPKVVVANRGSFNEVSPWIYGLARNGQIVAQVPERAAETAAGMEALRRSGIPGVPKIANVNKGTWGYEHVAYIMKR